MYDKGKIIPGIIIFVILFTFPFWYGKGKAYPRPEPEKPVKFKQCVEPTSFMKTSHMVLLNEWRNDAVRKAQRTYKGAGGKEYDISLQNTCMKCHSSKKNFCDRCHNYTGVSPYCWDCHIEPKETK